MEINNENNRKIWIMSIIGILSLILLTIGATYAYFTFSSNNEFGSQTIEAKTEAIGSGVTLTKVGEPLTLDVSALEMLEENIGTSYYATGSETPTQIGKISVAGDGTFNCTYTMTVSATSTSEDKNLYTKFQNFEGKSEGQIYLDINDTRYDFNTSNLFPITYSGSVVGITNASDSYITANMTIANTDIDQTVLNNADISLTFEVTQFDCDYINEDTKPVINSVSKTSEETDSITITVDVTSENGINKYYYAIDDREYVESESNTYTFDNLADNTSYSINVYVTDIYNLKSDVYTIEFSTSEELSAGETILVQAPSGLDTSTSYNGMYRYIGTTANNYVKLSDETNEVLYRIIGITSEANSTLGLEAGQIKLIKATSIGDYNWHTDNTSGIKWESSAVYTYLQGSSVLGSTSIIPSGWSDKIDSVKWYIGDVQTHTNASTIVGLEDDSTTSSASKIGLMYLSDYYYANTAGGTTNCGSSCSNWMTLGSAEWTMTRYGYYYYGSSGYYRAGYVDVYGNSYYDSMTDTNAVRPVFYLTTGVQYISGTGTSTDPFIIQ